MGLAVALAAAGILLGLPWPHPPGTDWTLAEAYPGVRPVGVPGMVDGGWAYTPMVFMDARTSAGTAVSGRRERLVVLIDGAVVRVLRDLDRALAPQFSGVTVAGRNLVWLEQTAERGRPAVAKIWSAPWEDAGTPTVLSDQPGDFAFFGSDDDLTVVGGRLVWVAVAPGTAVRTEVRTVPLAGGVTTTRTVDGAWQSVGGGVLATSLTAEGSATSLLDLRTGGRREVPGQPTELVSCGPDWCRVLVLGGDGGVARIDVMRPDGTGRRRVASGGVSAALADVARLGRWEVYSRAGLAATTLADQQVLLYDIRERRLITVTDGAGQILGRDGWIWWSAADAWQALDLRSLT